MQNNSDLSSKLQTGTIGWMGILAFLFVVSAVSYIGFLHYQKFVTDKAKQAVDQEIVQVNQEISSLQKDNVQAVFMARKGLDATGANQIAWSEVIEKLLKITPPEIIYQSYSGNEQGEIVLSGMAPSFAQASQIIKLLGQSAPFAEVFMPTVSQGITAAHQTLVNFSLKIKYLPSDNTAQTKPKTAPQKNAAPAQPKISNS